MVKDHIDIVLPPLGKKSANASVQGIQTERSHLLHTRELCKRSIEIGSDALCEREEKDLTLR